MRVPSSSAAPLDELVERTLADAPVSSRAQSDGGDLAADDELLQRLRVAVQPRSRHRQADEALLLLHARGVCSHFALVSVWRLESGGVCEVGASAQERSPSQYGDSSRASRAPARTREPIRPRIAARSTTDPSRYRSRSRSSSATLKCSVDPRHARSSRSRGQRGGNQTHRDQPRRRHRRAPKNRLSQPFLQVSRDPPRPLA